MNSHTALSIDGVAIALEGRLLRTARLADEYYVPAPHAEVFVDQLRTRLRGADVFTFVQELSDLEPRYQHPQHLLTWDDMAVLPVTTYAHWFDKQIKFKPRNRLRKAWKSGVETRVLPFDADTVRGIMSIYDETPLRQGKRNWHFGKDFDTVRREHATFLDRSEFIGAFHGTELIGFAKVTHATGYSIVMNIVSKVAQRDKAPMNALIAKCVELVAARGIPMMNYGVWGRRGLNEFKVANAFERVAVPRYHVPITPIGALALKLGLHQSLKERLPETWIVALADARSRWNEWRYAQVASPSASRGVPLPAHSAPPQGGTQT